jgi:hypothetical protein
MASIWREIMRTLLTAASLTIALAAAPAFAQATGGAGSATAGGTARPGSATAGTSTDYATGKSNVTPVNPTVNAATPGIKPNQNNMGADGRQNGAGNYQQRGTRDTEPSTGSQTHK